MTQAAAPSIDNADRNAAVVAGFLGWTLDAFDFAIVTLCRADIAKTYHVDPKDITFCISLTLLTRPIGAILFGLLADRYGRRVPMMCNLVFFSTLSVLSGLAPTYTTFMICRALFGVGMGGEWGVGASLALEKVPSRIRGLISGFLQEGYALGGLLASGAYFLILPLTHHWQPLFWIGGLPALLAIYIRSQVRESAVWEKTKKGSWSRLGSVLLSHWRLFLGIFILMLMMNLCSHGTQDLFPAMLADRFNLTDKNARGKIAGINAFSQVGMIIGGLVVGYLSDRIGRRHAMIGAFIGATIVVPLWAFAPNIALLLVGCFMLQFFAQGAWGVVPAHINELSPDSVRGSLPGFAYQCGSAASGAVLVVEEWLHSPRIAVPDGTGFLLAGWYWLRNVFSLNLSRPSAMFATAIILFPLAAVVVLFGKERQAVEFGTVGDGTPD
jgi:SHS family lactate transporter-like MFS transporter